MECSTVRRLEHLDADVAVAPMIRLLVSATILVTYAKLRFSAPHPAPNVSACETNTESVRGTLAISKTRRQNGMQRKRAWSVKGLGGSIYRAKPMAYYRASFYKRGGPCPSRCSPRVGHSSELDSAWPDAYAAAWRRMAALLSGHGGRYAPRRTSPRPLKITWDAERRN